MDPIHVVLVTASGCHFCDDARSVLDDLGARLPLSVEVIPMTSDTGRFLVVHHRVPFPPVVVINGSLFAYGRISRRKLERRLAELAGVEAVG